MIHRIIDLKEIIEKNKVTILFGPRQVGKTTLIKDFIAHYTQKFEFFTGDDIVFSNEFSGASLDDIKKKFSDISLLVIDEAQLIPNIGRATKLVIDNIPGITVILTGSSSFDLANKTSESLTGRKNVINLFPISFSELVSSLGRYRTEQNLSEILRFGSYPEVITLETYTQKEKRINEITNSYLIKDILTFDLVKASKIIIDLLRLLAFQIGNEVSLSELGSQLGVDKKTIARYLDLLEKSFVIFRLNGYSGNLRKEVTKMSKYYFYDLGIRNSLISNFNPIENRNDVGQLWENFLLIERIKHNHYNNISVNYYFWRTYDQKEIDLIEERNGELYGYECKWKEEKVKIPKDWIENYSNAHFEVINKTNYFEFITL